METDPTQPPHPMEPGSDASRMRMGHMRAQVRARLFEGIAGSPPQANTISSTTAPHRIGRYVVIERVGAGGMGVVYAAYDDRLDRRVAVKLLRPGSGPVGTMARQRLLREAQAIAKLSHRSVVQVYEVGTHDGEVFIAMEFVEGSTLKQWQPSRDWGDILERYLDAGRGLRAAHEAGIVHRDFKADNVLVRASDLTVRVVDFGLARTDEPSTDDAGSSGGTNLSLTHTGLVMGTPAYMAPEQHRADATDARTDQFSFCASLFEALYGFRAFAGNHLDELRHNVLTGAVEPAPAFTSVPTRVHRALERGLSVDPADRFPSMDALLAELQALRPRRLWIRALAASGVAAAVVAGAAALMNARTTPMHTHDAALRASFESARWVDEAAELERLHHRSAPQRWNDLVLDHAREQPTAAGTLATLRHLAPDDPGALGRARALAATALTRSPPFAIRTTSAAVTRVELVQQRLAARTEDGRVFVWPSIEGDAHFTAATDATDFAFAHDGRLLVLRNDGVLVTMTPGDPLPSTQTLCECSTKKIATDGRGTVAVASADGRVFVVTPDAQFKLQEHDATILALVFSPSGNTLASGDAAGHVVLWYLARDTHRTIDVDAEVDALRWANDGSLLTAHPRDRAVVSIDQNGKRRPWDADDIALTAINPPLDDGSRLELEGLSSNRPFAHPLDGHWAAAGHEDGVILWRVGLDEHGVGPRGERPIQLRAPVSANYVHAWGTRLFLTADDGAIVEQRGERFIHHRSPGPPIRAAFPSPDGSRLAIEDADDGALHVVDLATNPLTERRLARSSADGTGPLTWAHDGSAIAKMRCVAGRDACDVDVRSLDETVQWGLQAVPRGVRAVRVAPGGARIVMIHGRHVSYWESEARDTHPFAAPNDMAPLAVAFGPAGALRMAWANAARSHLRVDDVVDGRAHTVFEQRNLGHAIASNALDAVILETEDARTLLWRLSSDTFTALPDGLLAAQEEQYEVHLDPAGSRLWAAPKRAAFVRAVNLETRWSARLPRPRYPITWIGDEGWIERVDPQTLRQWGSPAPRSLDAFVAWLERRTQREQPVKSLREPVPTPVKPL